MFKTPASPLKLFETWFDEAFTALPKDADAMVLATATKKGIPSARVVLFKGLNPQGFRFFTNYLSRKGEELARNPQAALVFYWPAIAKQVRIEGKIKKLSPKESDAYWLSRNRASRISALASEQSREIQDRDVLEDRVEALNEAFDGEEIPRPKHWGGFVVIPEKIEFWVSQPDRLHDRTLYAKSGKVWKVAKLSP